MYCLIERKQTNLHPSIDHELFIGKEILVIKSCKTIHIPSISMIGILMTTFRTNVVDIFHYGLDLTVPLLSYFLSFQYLFKFYFISFNILHYNTHMMRIK